METGQYQSRARARTNIALVKYWGKADPALNTPAVGSISITLADLWTDTEVCFDAAQGADSLELDGHSDDAQTARVSAFLDLFVMPRAWPIGPASSATTTSRLAPDWLRRRLASQHWQLPPPTRWV